MLAVLKIALGSGLIVLAVVGIAVALGLVPPSVWALPPAVGTLTGVARLLGRRTTDGTETTAFTDLPEAPDSADTRNTALSPVSDHTATPSPTPRYHCSCCGAQGEHGGLVRNTWIHCSGVMIQVAEYSCRTCGTVLGRS